MEIKITAYYNHHFPLNEKMKLQELMEKIEAGHISDNQNREFSDNDTELTITLTEAE